MKPEQGSDILILVRFWGMHSLGKKRAMHARVSSLKLLSNRERDVFRLLLEGKSNKEISLSLAISEKTVEEHLTQIYLKLGVRSRTGAILRGMEELRVFPH